MWEPRARMRGNSTLPLWTLDRSGLSEEGARGWLLQLTGDTPCSAGLYMNTPDKACCDESWTGGLDKKWSCLENCQRMNVWLNILSLSWAALSFGEVRSPQRGTNDMFWVLPEQDRMSSPLRCGAFFLYLKGYNTSVQNQFLKMMVVQSYFPLGLCHTLLPFCASKLP